MAVKCLKFTALRGNYSYGIISFSNLAPDFLQRLELKSGATDKYIAVN